MIGWRNSFLWLKEHKQQRNNILQPMNMNMYECCRAEWNWFALDFELDSAAWRDAVHCDGAHISYRIVAVVVSFSIFICVSLREVQATQWVHFSHFILWIPIFFFFCFLISLSRFRANATNRNEFEYIKRIKIHPCVNEAHSRIFSIENACCVRVCIWLVFFWYFCCFSRSFKQYRGNESRDMKMNNFLFWLLYLVCRCSEQPLM